MSGLFSAAARPQVNERPIPNAFNQIRAIIIAPCGGFQDSAFNYSIGHSILISATS
jgi:hypothetical protein